ncbi:virulence protein RhuM/Fic/DOC family protein [Sphingobacterium sp. SGR-19]|uniref:virulence protein RhuM/Fic/DOC family protein n=1 Tax=Sphingobacterium sp. SGR-19 TaxID=2710886 RepID=UPI0013EAB3BF|nr:virulence protein RhuM/Fic/DOC family protein [Sphingobacterium sp. SGR-19]NGM64212.1 type II toxin-antitoxin system death-on-curing family toxin [Sphingobacterium sp. SGR-19]
MSKILMYQTKDNRTQIEVQFDKDTVWLNRQQISSLFDRDIKTIGKHIGNVFAEGELEAGSVVAKFATTASDGKVYQVEHYNLDVIISVGYRVKSKQGTAFRQWATQRLKEYLIQGYTINQKRLDELQQTVQFIAEKAKDLENVDEARGIMDIISQYTQSFVLLNQFDSNSIEPKKLNENITYEINYPEAKIAIAELKKQLIGKKEATALFGNEKDNSFEGTLQSVVQTFTGQYLYSSIEEQAAHLLYFIIKNHPFTDGNKRIGAFMFVWFLEKNKHRFKRDGEIKINDNALVTLALLVAQSDPQEKELMVKLITQLINSR